MCIQSYFYIFGVFSVIFPHGGNSDPAPASPLIEFRDIMEEYLPKDQPINYQENLLLRFLTSSHFNMDKAKESLMEYLDWRKTENVDSILGENWTDMEQRFPYNKPNITNELSEIEKTVLVLHIGQWNIGKLGEPEMKRLVRYATAKIMEDINNTTISRTFSEDREGGGDSTRFPLIINLQGFSLKKHGCLHCVRLLLEIMEEVGARWSQAMIHIFLANAAALPNYVHSWVADFSAKFGIPVNIRPDEKLHEYIHDDLVTSFIVFREHVYLIEEEYLAG